MKHYIITNNFISSNNFNNLTVLSYNVYWKAMKIHNIKKNILLNITNAINKYNPDLFAFQETQNYFDIIDLFNPLLYDYFVNFSGLETMLTVWNKQKFTLVKSFGFEFEKGRPFAVIILLQIKTQKHICLINLHAPHNVNMKTDVFNKISDFINNTINKTIKITRVIVAGDFNIDVNIDKNDKYEININNDKFLLFRSNDDLKTCCNFMDYTHTKNYDHILDSKTIITKKILGIVDKNYKFPSSDHILIIALLQKN